MPCDPERRTFCRPSTLTIKQTEDKGKTHELSR